MSSDIVNKALTKLIVRRLNLQKAIDAAMLEPASFSIQGSVSASARSIDEMHAELQRIDGEITALLTGNNGGIRRSYPDYNNR